MLLCLTAAGWTHADSDVKGSEKYFNINQVDMTMKKRKK